MGLWIKSLESFDGYNRIRLKDCNEGIICKIINDSKIVFPGRYKQIEVQDNGEPDFIEVDSTEKFDAKLLFKNEMCRVLSKDDYPTFLHMLLDYIGVNFVTQRERGPEELSLYIEMKSRIDSINDDENGILFLPYPSTFISTRNYFSNLCSDVFDYCFDSISTNKTIYLITVNHNQEIVLKKLGTNEIEYLPDHYLNGMITTEIVDYGVN